MLRFGDKYYVCPKCGSTDLKRDESGVGCLLGAALISFIFIPVLVLPILFIGIPYWYFNKSSEEEKNKIWKIQCQTCHHVFNIPDPTVKNNNSENVSNGNNNNSQNNNSNENNQ